MKVYVLANDIVKKRGFLAEHGLSLFIEYEDKKILFDAGQSDVFYKNAKALDVDLKKTDFIVLSHGHYDHCGGVPFFPFNGKKQMLYVRKNAFEKKFAGENRSDSLREIGISWKPENINIQAGNILLLESDINISDDIRLLGSIPSTVNFENLPEGLFVRRNGRIVADMLSDEQMMVIETKKGLVIFLGCSHPGVINCLHHALRNFPGKKIYALFAGMHLGNADEMRIQMTIKSISDLGIEKVFPLHCTGINAMCEFKKYLGERCGILYSGDGVSL